MCGILLESGGTGVELSFFKAFAAFAAGAEPVLERFFGGIEALAADVPGMCGDSNCQMKMGWTRESGRITFV